MHDFALYIYVYGFLCSSDSAINDGIVFARVCIFVSLDIIIIIHLRPVHSH